MKRQKLVDSFKYAISGIKSAFKTERNMKIHFVIMSLVVILGAVFNIDVYEWVACIFCFACVIGAEMFNTSIEKVVDLVCQERNEIAKLAKDISAGAVLVFAVCSAIIGLLIFFPKFICVVDKVFF